MPSAEAPARAEAGAAADARTIRAAFPAGAQAGTCLHMMLERPTSRAVSMLPSQSAA
ncbi:MAG: hypothetical protein U1E86_23195 [Burkholderiaceae bacterium]